MRFASGGLIAISVFLLGSCATERTYKETDLPGAADSGPAGPGTDARSLDIALPGSLGKEGMAGVKQIEAGSLEQMLAMHPIDELEFTDALNPDADNAKIDEAFSAATVRKQGWQQSYSDALRQARRTGKPILIWFHDSEKSPNSKSLAIELFEQNKFSNWAKNNLVRVKYDKRAKFEITGLGSYELLESEKLARRKEAYIEQAFEHFDVRGTPTLVMLHPDGQRFHVIKGYQSGTADNLFQELKHCARISAKQHQELRNRLKPSGYRDWHGRNDVTLFAQLVRYDGKTGDLWLKEFDGAITRTNLKSLSNADRKWVAANSPADGK